MRRNQSLAVEFLAYGHPKEWVADQLGIGKATLYRWLKEPAFCDALEQRTREVLSELSRRLSGLTLDNLGQFEGLLCSENESVKVRAWGIALARLTEITELARLEERLQALEERILSEKTG
jgi:hypothetical protein